LFGLFITQLNGNDIESDNDSVETAVDESLGKPIASASAEDGILDKYPSGNWTVKMINEDPEVQEAYHEYVAARVEALAKANR
jgi:hypothetical protein